MATRKMAPGLDESWVSIRMSTKDQEDSPTTQGQLAEQFIAQQELPVWSRTYFDLGISGKSLEKRPSILSMLADAERLRPACIVFYRLDRAFRNAEEQAIALNRLKRLGVRVLKVRDPNLTGPLGNMVDGILGNINQFERELTGMRIRDHNLAMAQRGEWSGGPAPFGYRYRKPVKEAGRLKARTIQPGAMEPHPEEWPVAQQLWEWALAGYRQAQIMAMAQECGYHRRSGQPWIFTRLTAFYRNRFYAGYMAFGHHSADPDVRGEWYHGSHEPMITLEQWYQVQAQMFHQGTAKQRSRHAPRAELSGLISCQLCGGPVGCSGVTPDKGYVYTCIRQSDGTVGHRSLCRREWILHLAARQVLMQVATLIPKRLPPDDSDRRRTTLQREIATLEGELTRVRQAWIIGAYGNDLTAYQRDQQEREARIAIKAQELAATGPAADELRRRHEALQKWTVAYEAAETVLEKQRLWRLFIERIEFGHTELLVTLCDLGAGIPRYWRVTLPTRKVRMPGTRNCGHGGIVGAPKNGRPSQGYLATVGLTAEPVTEPVAKRPESSDSESQIDT